MDQMQPSPSPPTGSSGAKRPIAVIGAGLGGMIAALKLLRRLPPDQPVLLCGPTDQERPGAAAKFQAGIAMNVRAGNLSAVGDNPAHFEDWLQRHVAPGDPSISDTDSGVFAARALYDSYLTSLLDQAGQGPDGKPRLRRLDAEASDIVALDDGGYSLLSDGSEPVSVAGVVLAVGNLPPEEGSDERICRSPWSLKAWRPLSDDLPVLIVGTGLTTVDLAVAIHKRGFGGRIIAMSRSGLLPARHAATGAWPVFHPTMAEEQSLSLLLTRLRDEVDAAADQGIGWRAVIDSLRPITATLWARLPVGERQRFLRHARRLWDLHRHRSAPPNAAVVERLLSEGRLSVIGGRIVGFDTGGDRVSVRYVPRGGDCETAVEVQLVIMASGLVSIARARDRLIQRLLDRGQMRLDPQELGIEVTEGLNVVRRDGSPAERMWALGPIVRGVFWECVAVPDICVQASQLAVGVVARLREDAPRASFLV